MISAGEFSRAGFKYLGRSYKEMDCQAFVEQCMSDCGLYKNLKGSNAWYRAMDWTGTPEECITKFGSIPKGAFLFIHAYDGGEIRRGYHDGKGNASHIGIKTGIGEGAIHSSEKRGGVAESLFQDKTVRNGGWNCVGLSKMFAYNEKINSILQGNKPGESEGDDEMPESRTAVTWAASGSTVNMRASAKDGAALVERVPVGETVTILGKENGRTKCQWKKWTGWIADEFLRTSEPEDGQDEQDEPETQGGEWKLADNVDINISMTIDADTAYSLLEVLDAITEKIAMQIGRG